MMKRNKIILFTALLAVIAGISYKVYAQDNKYLKRDLEINQNENIVFLGDSLFDYFKTEIVFDDLPIVNSGISGHTTTDILNNLENRLYRYNPTKVFLMIGVNDLYHNQDEPEEQRVEEVYKNITLIIEKIRKNRPKCEIFAISILPINDHPDYEGPKGRHKDDIDKINAKLAKYCEGKEMITYIDANSSFRDSEARFRDEYTYDGLHLNELGYIKFTEILMKYIY